MTSGTDTAVDVAVIGAGSIGIAVAYYLVENHRLESVVLIDPLDPMSLTSAQSGENYRNWWPHPAMTAFTNDGIDLLEKIAIATGNRINMTRRGYALVTRRSTPEDLITDLRSSYRDAAENLVRIYEPGAKGSSYNPPISASWETAPEGVDVLCDRSLIRETFPTFAHDVATVLHIRRAGSISGQQLGQFMLEAIRARGGRVLRGTVAGIESTDPFDLIVKASDGRVALRAQRIVNAGGPLFKNIANLMNDDVPASCVFQQKIAFEDRERAIPRTMPFTIDLDRQELPWSAEERAILAEDPRAANLLEPMIGGVHCRPDGPENGSWIKLGWAYNQRPTDPAEDDPIDPQFPDTVLRGASRLHAGLKAYIGRLPRNAHHYGGYYTMTEENWPLIGPMRTPGAFMAGALSGFGTMSACVAGSICAAWVCGTDLPSYARAFSLARYDDKALMSELDAIKTRGVL